MTERLSEKTRPRPGRPELNPEDPLRILTVGVSGSLYAKTSKAAFDKGVSMSALVREALELLLQKRG